MDGVSKEKSQSFQEKLEKFCEAENLDLVRTKETLAKAIERI